MATSPPSDPSVRSATPAVGALPEPPPVFTAVAPDRYRIELSALVGKLDLVVHATGLQLGREAVDFDSIRHIRLQLNPGTADLTVELDVGGRNVKVRYHRSGGRAGADRNAQVFAYLWEVVGTQVAPRLQQTLVDQVQAGRLVEVAGLRVGPEGVGSRRVGPVPWSAVGPVVADGLALVVPLGTSGVRVDCGARDAVLVEGLLAGLRAVRA